MQIQNVVSGDTGQLDLITDKYFKNLLTLNTHPLTLNKQATQ